ncbi:MAG: response regulator [Micrococcales bacterium]
MAGTIRIGLLFGNKQIRDGRRMLLGTQRDFDIVYEGSDGLAAIDELLNYSLDVILVDNRLQNLSGLQTIQRFLRRHSDGLTRLPGFVLTGPFGSPEMELQAIRAGAIGTVTEEDSAQAVIDRVRRAGQTRESIDTEYVNRVFANQGILSGSNQRWLLRLVDLPADEQRVLDAIGSGISFDEISNSTGLSIKRVNETLGSMQRRLGLATRHQLYLALYEAGVIKPLVGS